MWFKNLLDCYRLSKTDPEFMVYVDNDDPQLEQYKSYLPQLTQIDVKFIIGKPLRSAKAMKYLAQHASRNYMIFGTDDLNWKTEGWDEKLIAKMPEHGLSVICPATAPDNKIKAMVPFFTRKWMEITGLFPDEFVHFGPDSWVVKVAQIAKTDIYAYDIEILHKKINDETSARARKNGGGAIRSKMPRIEEIAEKVKAQIND
jgi:hypothetical protein